MSELTSSPTQANYLSSLEKGIIDEMNRARTNPAAYADWLETIKSSILTQEGPAVIDEAIQFLRSTSPLQPLTLSQGMTMAARDHVSDQGPKGLIGHVGTDGSSPTTRVSRYGTGTAGENISYGENTAQDVVRRLIVDDGVSSRGHRANIFNADYQFVGIDSGPHALYNMMTVITYSFDYTDSANLPPLPDTPREIEINFPLGAGTPEAASPTGLAAFTAVEQFFTLSDNADGFSLSQFPEATGKFVLSLNGNDYVLGTANADDINGNRGNDDLWGGGGQDFLRGGKDFDSIRGEDGNDTLNGNNQNDTVYGGAGDDLLRGGKDSDILLGELGNDILVGDFGQDSLIGGTGGDIFVFRADANSDFKNTSSVLSEVDIIGDFAAAEGDKIALTDGLTFANLIFEEIEAIASPNRSPAMAVRLNTSGEYVGIVLNADPSSLQNSSNFIAADTSLIG